MTLLKKLTLYSFLIIGVASLGRLELSTSYASFYKLADGETLSKLRSIMESRSRMAVAMRNKNTEGINEAREDVAERSGNEHDSEIAESSREGNSEGLNEARENRSENSGSEADSEIAESSREGNSEGLNEARENRAEQSGSEGDDELAEASREGNSEGLTEAHENIAEGTTNAEDGREARQSAESSNESSTWAPVESPSAPWTPPADEIEIGDTELPSWLEEVSSPPVERPRRRYAAYNECMRRNRHIRPISARIERCAHLRP